MQGRIHFSTKEDTFHSGQNNYLPKNYHKKFEIKYEQNWESPQKFHIICFFSEKKFWKESGGQFILDDDLPKRFMQDCRHWQMISDTRGRISKTRSRNLIIICKFTKSRQITQELLETSIDGGAKRTVILSIEYRRLEAEI
jgi:hypothetical protein